jgi:putative acetyltransferase
VSVAIKRADPQAKKFLSLHAAREEYLGKLYPAESNHRLDLEAMCQPQMTFFGIYFDDTAVGCGGFWAHENYAEIKSMWIEPAFRGRGYSKMLMARIEEEAARVGLGLLRLETGIYQPEALALYRGVGYIERGAYGAYGPDHLSVFMEKLLPR